jgi:hypothetical protein
LTIAILTALTPTVAVLLATIIQRQDVRDLRSDMNKLRGDMQSDSLKLRTDLQTEMVALRNQVHADLLMIHERVARVEAKQGN